MSTDIAPILARRSVPELVEWGKEALDRAGTLPEVRKVKATAAAVEAYQRSINASEEAVAASREIKTRASRRLGAELAGIEKAKGQLRRGSKKEPRKTVATLADLGVGKKESANAQALANASAAQFEAGIEALKTAGELTETNMQKLMREAVRGGMGPKEIKAVVAAVKAKRTPEERARLAAEDAAIDAIGLVGEEAWRLDPETCARGTTSFLRAGQIVKANACRDWLDRYVAELERLNAETL